MKRWIISPKKSDDIVGQLLANRDIGLKDKENFLNPDYERDMYDPFLFKDMQKAIDRITKAIEDKEKIGIFADYDADGIPGAALLYKVFSFLKTPIEIYIPSREEGYGLNKNGIKELSEKNCKVIISVDLGIADGEKVDFGNKSGIDFIITDHHEIQKKLFPKNAYAIIHPRLEKQKYPNPHLAGGGVAWKLAQGLLINIARMSQLPGKQSLINMGLMKWLLDLAAISTITDIVPLVGENRVITKYGLIVLNKTKNLGLKKLYEVAGIDQKEIGTYTVGFQIGPRINAPGRMDHASTSYYLLTTEDESEAMKLAKQLNEINQDRQQELSRVLAEAKEKIVKDALDKKRVILLKGKDWPAGIVGLVAGKLMEEYSRPVIVFSQDKDQLKGSARSIDEFHLVEAFDQAKEFLLKHGGHAKAAGLTLEEKHFSNLYDRLLEVAESKIKDGDLIPKIRIDAEISPKDISMNLYKQLEKFEPFGMGNPRPVFLVKGLEINNIRTVGTEGKHLKLKVSYVSKVSNTDTLFFDAIGFDLGSTSKELTKGEKIDIVFTLDENNWNDRRSIQLRLLDIRKGGIVDEKKERDP